MAKITKAGEDKAWAVSIPERYALLNRMILRDLNKYYETKTFKTISKNDIIRWLFTPQANEKNLREAVRYIYNASSHFRSLIQYFVGLTDLAYVVEPYRTDYRRIQPQTLLNNYRRVLNTLSVMSLKTQLPKVLTVVLREDVFYGTFWVTADDIMIQQLPSEYCRISTIEGNVPNVTFNFSYFDFHLDQLDYYPPEFRRKYEQIYKKDINTRWIDLDCPNSFAIKCNNDIMDYAIPPFAGILREVFELEDYKQLKLTKTALENYAMIAMNIPLNSDGSWGIDLDKAFDFFKNLEEVLPEEIGAVLTPMPLDKISFERAHTGDTDTIADSERNLYSAAGVSSLLFNNDKASANALLLSIKVDQALTYGIVKSIQDVINRFIQAQTYGKYFTVNFLDVSRFNQKEMADAYLKAASYGFPTISMYAATMGLGQAELDSMSYLEGEVLELHKLFKPVVNSTQMSGEQIESEVGRPTKENEDIADKTEINRELE